MVCAYCNAENHDLDACEQIELLEAQAEADNSKSKGIMSRLWHYESLLRDVFHLDTVGNPIHKEAIWQAAEQTIEEASHFS